MNAHALAMPFFWLLNGALALIYLLAEHALVALLALPLVQLTRLAPDEQRPWTLAAVGLALAAALIAPQPVPFWLLVMAVAGVVTVSAEQFNPLSLSWRIISGLALYALAGIGFAIFEVYLGIWAEEHPLLDQGQHFISVLIGVALYGVPLGYLVLLAQALWAHPPMPGKPAEIINTLRARGRE